MHVAASEGQVKIILFFLYSMIVALSQLIPAVLYFTQLEIVKFLIENGSDVNAEDKFKNTCLNDAVRHKYSID